MHEELAVGGVSADELSRAWVALLRQASEADDEAATRARLREALPRASAACGRLFGLEALRLAPAPGGATDVTSRVRIEPAGLDAGFPSYARFLRRYVPPMRVHAVARDEPGAPYWELDFRDSRALLRLRVRGDRLVALEGPPWPLPDRLRVRLDLTTRSGWFRVGFLGLLGDATLVRDEHERAFVARFREAPDWALPFLIEPFLRSSLHLPFEGEGALLSYTVRDAPGTQTLLVRDYRVAVRESWIVRWLGGFTGSAMEEFRREAEPEADRFSAECLMALGADLAALVAPEP